MQCSGPLGLSLETPGLDTELEPSVSLRRVFCRCGRELEYRNKFMQPSSADCATWSTYTNNHSHSPLLPSLSGTWYSTQVRQVYHYTISDFHLINTLGFWNTILVRISAMKDKHHRNHSLVSLVSARYNNVKDYRPLDICKSGFHFYGAISQLIKGDINCAECVRPVWLFDL